MGCRAWMEGGCDCDQPCDDSNDEIVIPYYERPGYVSQEESNMVKLKEAFNNLMQAYEEDYPKHIVWSHFELVDKLLTEV